MHRDRSHLLTIGLMVTMAVVGVALAVATLRGMDSSSGDVMLSSSGPAGMATVLIGSLLLFGLEFLHTRGRQPKRRSRFTPAGARVRI